MFQILRCVAVTFSSYHLCASCNGIATAGWHSLAQSTWRQPAWLRALAASVPVVASILAWEPSRAALTSHGFAPAWSALGATFFHVWSSACGQYLELNRKHVDISSHEEIWQHIGQACSVCSAQNHTISLPTKSYTICFLWTGYLYLRWHMVYLSFVQRYFSSIHSIPKTIYMCFFRCSPYLPLLGEKGTIWRRDISEPNPSGINDSLAGYTKLYIHMTSCRVAAWNSQADGTKLTSCASLGQTLPSWWVTPVPNEAVRLGCPLRSDKPGRLLRAASWSSSSQPQRAFLTSTTVKWVSDLNVPQVAHAVRSMKEPVLDKFRFEGLEG